MEEPQSLANSGLDRSEQTGKTLRKLRKQADQTLDSHRRRLTNIESELNLHFQQITEELARDRVVDEMEVEASQKLQAEFQSCQEMLTQVEAGMEELRQEAEATNAQLDEQIAELEQLREQCLQNENERTELVSKQDQLLQTLDQAQGESELLQKQLASLSEEHGAQLEERFGNQEQLQQQVDETQAERDRLAEQLEQLREKNHESSSENDRLQGELAATDQLRNDLLAAQKELESQQEQSHKTQQSLESAEANQEKTVSQLREAQQRIEELESDEEASEQLDQLQRKFDLVLADVHKLKCENAELHEELACRPEADQQESPELVSLRAERDVLATRVDELENAPPVESDPQEASDLQRRFEMAVEDVRQLKQDNVSLQEQLKSVPTAGPVKVDDGAPLDWQAQKALLLAELEAEENDGVVPERREARTTIEGTISITDRVVAEKDKEISQLQEQLDSRPVEASVGETPPGLHAELFDQDELIQAERTRLEEAREEMEQKLREAEIDISVRRATLAREQAALQEKMALIPEEKVVEAEAETTPGKPRRRWLSALGLKDDEEE